jgi:hypothetical protein
MANSFLKNRKDYKNTKKTVFVVWKPLTFYLGGSTVTYGDDAYIITRDYTSSANFLSDLGNGTGINNSYLRRISNPLLNGNFALGPYYVRSGDSLTPTVSQPDIKWLGNQFILTGVRVDFAGAGDGKSDGGYPWGAYNFYFYFKKLEL